MKLEFEDWILERDLYGFKLRHKIKVDKTKHNAKKEFREETTFHPSLALVAKKIAHESLVGVSVEEISKNLRDTTSKIEKALVGAVRGCDGLV